MATLNDLMIILGEKEVEIRFLKQEVQDLKDQLAQGEQKQEPSLPTMDRSEPEL